MKKKLPVFPPDNIIDLSKFNGTKGRDLEEFVKEEFHEILEKDGIALQKCVPFSNRFELLRIDTLHRKNIKIRDELK